MKKSQIINYEILPEESLRIDLLKTISITLVVYIHSYVYQLTYVNQSIEFIPENWAIIFISFFSHVLGSTAVPLFLLFSAVLLFKRKRDYLKMLKNKSKSLLVPFLFWNTLWIIVFAIFQLIPPLRSFFDSDLYKVFQYDWTDWLFAYGFSFDSPFLYPLWFIRDLIVMTIISPLIIGLVRRIPNITLVLALVIYLLPLYLPYKTALVFFIIGAYVVVKNIRMDDLNKLPLWLLFIIHAVFGLMKLHQYIVAYESISILAGVLFWIIFSKRSLENNSIKNLSNMLFPYLFVIYATHEYVLTGMKKILERILPNNDMMLILQYLILPIFIIALCAILAKVLKTIVPQFYNLITGSR